MVPKRKLIRKQYVAAKHNKDQTTTNPQNISQMLKSIDPAIKHEAISIIANLEPLPPIVLESTTLLQLVNILYSSNNALINSVLFALDHICFHSVSSIQTLFRMGLDKALIHLDFNDVNLHVPILILITTLAADVQPTYQYFFEGVQKTLATEKYLSCPNADLVMEFLIRSKYYGELPQMVIHTAKMDHRYYVRALSVCLLVRSTKAYNEDFLNLFKGTFSEFLTDIDLESEFKDNIEHEIEKTTPTMINSKAEFEGMDEEGENKGGQSNLSKLNEFFEDSFEGLRFMLNFINDVLEDAKEDQIEEEQFSDEEQEMVQEEIVPQGQWNQHFVGLLTSILFEHVAYLKKNLKLSFPEGFKITQLVLKILLELPSSGHETIINFIEETIIEICNKNIPKQTLSQQLSLCLQIILKNKHVANRNLYTELALHFLKIEHIFKQCWMFLLQIFSLHYNPEKVLVSQKQNKQIGIVLKKLITDIPELELQEWRGQAIDTLFDVYSNESFDGVFVELGFFPLLKQLQQMGQGKGKKSKFIKAVLTDINRFLAYKQAHIKL